MAGLLTNLDNASEDGGLSPLKQALFAASQMFAQASAQGARTGQGVAAGLGAGGQAYQGAIEDKRKAKREKRKDEAERVAIEQARAEIEQNRRMAENMQRLLAPVDQGGAGLLESLTPEQRAVYGSMPPEKGMAALADMLKPPPLPTGYIRGPDGQMTPAPGYVQGRAQLAAAEAKARQPYGDNASGGPFAGTGMTAQATNAYMRLALKKQRGEPLTPQENLEFALAKRQLESSRIVQGEDGVNYILPPQPLPGDESPSGPTVAVPGVTPKLTEDQAKAAGFYDRAAASSDIMDNLTGKANTSAIMIKNIAASPPLLGPILGAGVNAMMKPESQNMEQAQRDFVNAVLRRESQAVINPDEFSNAQQQYFPQPGDSEEVIKQKKANRLRVIQSLKLSSGKYTPQPSEDKSEDKGEWVDVGNGVRIRKKP